VNQINTQKTSYFYKLKSPFNHTPYHPLDSLTMAKMLDMSHKTAIRICQNLRPLKPHELTYLQIMIFGLIPDKAFIREKMFFYNGALRCHRLKNFELTPSEASSFADMRIYYISALESSIQAKDRIKELEAIIEGKKPNAKIIQFSDYVR
jgi:hypothetical protein